MIRIPVARIALVLVGVVGCLGFFGWYWLEVQSSQEALAAHLERTKPYAARVLEEVAVLPDELRESSGLAISRTQPGVLWSHNDSGDGPILYAIDISARLLGRFKLTNATAKDWEDMSLGPCPADIPAGDPQQRDCLFVADMGDNDQVRSEVTIYIVREPRVGGAGTSAVEVPARSFRFRYPEKPDDAEALAVRPNGDITIVTKGRSGTIDFFSIAAESVAKAIASGDTLVARPNGNTAIQPESQIGRLVTAAAVSPDGMTLAVRTYYDVFFYKLVNDGGQTRWEDLRKPCSLGDAEPQGEAIDFLDANTLLLTSERSRGRPGTIHRVQC
jgi:hypothetical protein